MDYLKVVPSYQCDRGCTYCYNTALGQVAASDEGALFRALDEVIAGAQRPFVVEVIGGEPLQGETRSTTLRILRRVNDVAACRRTMLSTAIGDPAHLEEVLPLLDFLYFSVDITRARENRKRTSQRYLRTLTDLCKSHGTELSVSVVLDGTESAAELAWFLDGLMQLGIRTACFGYVSFHVLERARLDRYAASFHALFRAQCVLGESLRIGGDVVETLGLRLDGKVRRHNCHCGQTSVVIQPDGKISPSICFEDAPGAAIAFEEFMQAKVRRESDLLAGKCGSCELWGACQGGCMGAAYKSTGRYSARDVSFCSILRSTWRLIEQDLVAAIA